VATAPLSPEGLPPVVVSMKVVEYQTDKDVETGLSAYFRQRQIPGTFGRVSTGKGNIVSADLTFPTDTSSGITVFLDRIRMDEGDIEIVLQGLVEQNRAHILSRPKALVPVASPVPTVIKTTQSLPYENTQVVGVSTVQVTSFRDSGVTLTVSCPQAIDDDGDLLTLDDRYIQLDVQVEVIEEGQRLTVALDDRAASSIFADANNAIQAPELVSRSMKSKVWVRNGQVLLLGGLYRNSRTSSVTSLPWLTNTEDALLGAAERIVPTEIPPNPLSSLLGNKNLKEGRRELVFMLKAEFSRSWFMTPEDVDFGPAELEEVAGAPEEAAPAETVTELVVDEAAAADAGGEG
jgi:Flp pilus assembly secretin CpaC